MFHSCRDGGIEAVIDHEGGWMTSREVADVYSTEEPQAAFHARVAFCLDVHNEACPLCHLPLLSLLSCTQLSLSEHAS